MEGKVAVTGSTGFIGRHLSLHLARAGWQVRAILRPETTRAPPAESEPVVSPLQRNELTVAFNGCDLVIHLAGKTRAPSLKDYLPANAGAAEQVALAARASGARLVHVSSQAAAGTGTLQKPRTETDIPDPITDYGKSKLAGEQAVRRIDGLAYTILRPSAVYGPGDRDFLSLFRCAWRGFFPVLAKPDSAFSFLYISDLVRAIEIVGCHPQALSEVFFVAHNEPHTADDFLRVLARTCHKTYRPTRVPRNILWLVMALGVPAAKLGLNPLLTPSKYREILSEGFVCSPKKLQKATDFTAQVNLNEGLGRTHAWYTCDRNALEAR
jgi:dihydroflavonol-4-reductase